MPDETDEPRLYRVDSVVICELCLDGVGGICHVPGCLFCWKTAPDISIRQTIIDFGGAIQEQYGV